MNLNDDFFFVCRDLKPENILLDDNGKDYNKSVLQENLS